MPVADPRQRALIEGQEAFGPEWRPAFVSQAPGRLELLGNHIDYNGGPVLAAAIDRVVVALVDPSGEDGTVSLLASDIDPAVHAIETQPTGDWRLDSGEPAPADYLRGVIAALLSRGVSIVPSARLSVAGNVPPGFGVSSSAALVVALINAVGGDHGLTQREIVLAAQDAEHRCGVPSGTMDQSASVVGDVIAYDGATTTFTILHPDLGPYAFAVADSGVSRSLASSSYPERVKESQEALRLLQQRLTDPPATLAGIMDDQWAQIEAHHDAWLPETLFKRARHVYTECRRVRDGIAAIARRDWPAFGRLMTASGRSSAQDYEISHPRVEEIVAAALTLDGVLGARMMGGGEGGPALILLERAKFDAIRAGLLGGAFPPNTPEDRIQLCTFGPGASVQPATDD
jgi:galactokinase